MNDFRNDGNTEARDLRLHQASANNVYEEVITLLENGVDINTKYIDGNTLLHYAVHANAIETMQILIQNGADLNAQNLHRYTPLHVASGADLNAPNFYGAYVRPKYRTGKYETEKVKLLLERGADIQAKAYYDNTALHEAALANLMEIAKLLLEYGADTRAKDAYDRTPLHQAAKANALEIAKLLLEYGAAIDAKDNRGETCLHKAICIDRNPRGTAKLLLEYGAAIDAKNNRGETCLHMEAEKYSTKTMKFFLENGAAPNAQDVHGRTPLHIAVEELYPGDHEFSKVGLLLLYGADMNSQNIAGTTPLDVAALAHTPETAFALLDVVEVITKKKTPCNLNRSLWNIFKQDGPPKTSQAVALEGIKIPKVLSNFLFYLRENSDLLKVSTYIPGITALANHHESWLRSPEAWHPTGRNRDRQFSELARHLLAIYDVPDFMDSVWFKGNATYQNWFKHIGAGQNIRTAPGLLLPLTKKMAHHFMTAPNDYTLEEAFRWGQVHALGGDSRLANALRGTKMTQDGRDLWKSSDLWKFLDLWEDPKDFWVNVIRFFIRNPMLDMIHVGPTIDYIWEMRYEVFRTDFTMKGRTPEALLRRVVDWHDRLGRSRDIGDLTWRPSGIGAFCFLQEHDRKLWSIRELLNTDELLEEGRRLSHCVASYAGSCYARSSSIWTMEIEENNRQQKVLTIEVALPQKRIRQMRGKDNRLPTPEEKSIIKKWADIEGLQLASYI